MAGLVLSDETYRAWRAAHYGVPPPVHGTRSSYGNYGCRGAECRRANREYMNLYNARKRKKMSISQDPSGNLHITRFSEWEHQANRRGFSGPHDTQIPGPEGPIKCFEFFNARGERGALWNTSTGTGVIYK